MSYYPNQPPQPPGYPQPTSSYPQPPAPAGYASPPPPGGFVMPGQGQSPHGMPQGMPGHSPYGMPQGMPGGGYSAPSAPGQSGYGPQHAGPNQGYGGLPPMPGFPSAQDSAGFPSGAPPSIYPQHVPAPGFGAPSGPAYGAPVPGPSYGAPASGPPYGAPASSPYGAPASSPYGTDSAGFPSGAPPSTYPQQPAPPFGAPAPGPPYGAPASGSPYGAPAGPVYGAPAASGSPYGAPAPGYGAPVAHVDAYFNSPTVFYRGIAIHDPQSAGRLAVPLDHQVTSAIQRDIAAIIASKGSEKKLIATLTRLGPLKMEVVIQEFPKHSHKGKSLMHLVEENTNGYVKKGLMGLVLGPLQYDATQVYDAIAGAGTKEKLLNEIVLGLSPSDVALLAVMYRQKYNKVLSDHVTGDLKGDTKKLFALQLAPGRSFATASDVSADANSLHKAGDGKFMGKDEDTIFAILMERPYAHLKQVSLRYREQHKKSLTDAVESKFRGDAEDALVWLVRGFETHRKHPHLDPASVREAEMLEQTMKGMGTKDELLLMRLLRAHWSRGRMADVCAAYKGVYGKALSDRVKGETSGAHEDLLMALIQ